MQRKIMCITCVLASVAIMLSGCGNDFENYSSSSTNSVLSNIGSSSNSTSSFFEEEINANSATLSSIGIQKTEEIDVRKEDGEYTYNDKGQVIGFSMATDQRPKNIKASLYLSEEKLREIAENYLKNYVSLEKFTYAGFTEYPERQEYRFDYVRKISGYSSHESLMISLVYDGTVVNYYAANLGMFDNVYVPEIDELKILKQLDIMVKQRQGNISYDIKDSRSLVILEDETLAMQIEIYINDDESFNDFYFVPIE